MNVLCCKEFTGHMHYGSPYETSGSCGNCDGAKCERCKTMYVVEDIDNGTIHYMGQDFEEAKKFGYNREAQASLFFLRENYTAYIQMADISRSAVEDILFNMRKKLEEQSLTKSI